MSIRFGCSSSRFRPPTGLPLTRLDWASTPESAAAGRYPWVVLGMLWFVYVLNFLSRQLPSILAKPIQDDLHVSDGKLGLISGLNLLPGMYELNEEVVCRCRTNGDIAWNWSVGIASPRLPAHCAVSTVK